MAKENWEDAFKAVLKHEGGFVNHPRDPGGMTNLGVTKRAWEEYTGQLADESEMRSLTSELVKPFYKAKYWDKIKGDDLPSGVDYAAYDLAVNSGPARAAKYLQQIVGVPADGIIGPKTMAAIKDAPADEVIDALCGMRMDFLKALPTFDTFGKGWTRRVAEVETKAKGMA
jgi:lysozyme family protein